MTPPPRLIVFSGLPGVGKSALAARVANRLGCAWIRIDAVEEAILEAGLPRSFETGLAAYLGARNLARDQLRIGESVLIDAVNGVAAARQMWNELSQEFGAARPTIYVVCSDRGEHRRRVEGRTIPPRLPRLTWGEVLGREFEPWTEAVLTVDSSHPLTESVSKIVDYCGKLARERKQRPQRPTAFRPARARRGP
jgi:predicted kinase